MRIDGIAHKARAALPSIAACSSLSCPPRGATPRAQAPAAAPARPPRAAAVRCDRGRRASGREPARSAFPRSSPAEPTEIPLARWGRGRYSPASLPPRSAPPAGRRRPLPGRPLPTRTSRPTAPGHRARRALRPPPAPGETNGPSRTPAGIASEHVQQREDLGEPADRSHRNPVVAGRLSRDRRVCQPQDLGGCAEQAVGDDHTPAVGAGSRPSRGFTRSVVAIGWS